MEAGIDSIEMPRALDALGALLEQKLAPTLLLEHGTVRQLARALFLPVLGAEDVVRRRSRGSCQSRHLLLPRRLLHAQTVSQCPRAQVCAPRALARTHADEMMALRSSVGRWPGAFSVATLSPLAAVGGNAIVQVPALRWASRGLPRAVHHGGFVCSAQRFDNGFFSISPAEAYAIDPQQRVLLEVGYEATHGASLRRGALLGSAMSVSVSIMNNDFVSVATTASVYAATGTQISIASGRLSFALGTQGPCVTVDTACSSSLVALDTGMESLQRGIADGASLAAAANFMLLPQVSLLFERVGMLSIDGRCKTLDARANGYVRGEGVGAIVIGAAEAAREEAAGIDGCAVRSDGRSSSLLAPNGTAQASLIRVALSVAGVERLCVIEAHGTGTSLGDATELGALERALGKANPRLCATKANLGHTEPVAGLAGLLALARLRADTVNAQLRALNPVCAASQQGLSSCLLVQRLPIGSSMKGAGVSSFGYGGTIAHAVLTPSLGLLSELTGSQLDAAPRLAYRRRTFLWLDTAEAASSMRTSVYATCWAAEDLTEEAASGPCLFLASGMSLAKEGAPPPSPLPSCECGSVRTHCPLLHADSMEVPAR
jgi:acyl transferase domain-containing protein